jgi:OPA family glycerol-3-phosphate transporter-like MFS transporter 1/2
MGNWFCDKKSIENRGLIFGLWTCHQYLGDISAAVCTAIVLGAGFDYTYALLIPACTNAAWGYLTMRLVADPADIGIITPEVKIRLEKLKAKQLETGMSAADEGPAPITYAAALRIPMVANYAFAFGFFKLTNYVLFFWLPYFLGKHFDPVTANLIASLYSVGMMPGGIIVGVVSDLFGGRRASVIGTFMGCLMIFLFIFSKKSEELSAVALLMMLAIMGILVGGPNNIITSAVIHLFREITNPLELLLDLLTDADRSLRRLDYLPSALYRTHLDGAPFGSSLWGALSPAQLLWGARLKTNFFPLHQSTTFRCKRIKSCRSVGVCNKNLVGG